MPHTAVALKTCPCHVAETLAAMRHCAECHIAAKAEPKLPVQNAESVICVTKTALTLNDSVPAMTRGTAHHRSRRSPGASHHQNRWHRADTPCDVKARQIGCQQLAALTMLKAPVDNNKKRQDDYIVSVSLATIDVLLQERLAPSAVTHRISTLHPYNTRQQTGLAGQRLNKCKIMPGKFTPTENNCVLLPGLHNTIYGQKLYCSTTGANRPIWHWDLSVVPSEICGLDMRRCLRERRAKGLKTDLTG